jgi:hypothetical protein
MFRAHFCSSSGGTVRTAIGIFLCVLCLLATASSQPTSYAKRYQLIYIQYLLMMSKNVLEIEAIYRNKLQVNNASCWSYYADILRRTVSKTLN